MNIPDVVQLIFGWLHFLAGITWIGLLYFLNVVNVPFMRVLDPAARPQVVPTLLPRVLAWFRHAAWVTVLAGLVLIYDKYWREGGLFATDAHKTIFMGMVLGLIMLFNVWVFVWPNQRKIINAVRAGQTADPSWARIALYASRTNFTLSFPMLLYMRGASHSPMDWAGIIVYGLIAAAIGAAVFYSVQKLFVTKF